MKCEYCQLEKKDVKKRRQMTAYHNEKDNFAVLCDDCQDDADRYWTDMWNEYYNSQGI